MYCSYHISKHFSPKKIDFWQYLGSLWRAGCGEGGGSGNTHRWLVAMMTTIWQFCQCHMWIHTTMFSLCLCVCVCVYLPTCIIQGCTRAHIVLSQYLYLSNISLNFCTFADVTISSLNLFQTSTVLCGKLYFLMWEQV